MRPHTVRLPERFVHIPAGYTFTSSAFLNGNLLHDSFADIYDNYIKIVLITQQQSLNNHSDLPFLFNQFIITKLVMTNHVFLSLLLWKNQGLHM